MSQRFRVVTLVVLAVAIVGGVVAWQFRNTATDVDADDVIARFDAASTVPATTTTQAPPVTTGPPATTSPPVTAEVPIETLPESTLPVETIDPDAPPSVPLPAPGVYRLAVTGSESLDLLTGASHEYPPEGFLTVVPSACGVELRVDFIVERWQTWTVCEGPAGAELIEEQIFHSFFGQNDLVVRACADSPLVADVDAWTCEGETSVARRSVSASVERRSTAVGEREVLVVTTRLVEGDHPDNVEDIELWLDLDTGLPMFETRRYDFTLATPFGEAGYLEDYSFELVSLEPVSG
ncbi:MAG: hypothetical protein RLZZ01_1293 [Actinomycetota bacterium]|jgi:hypothetical protein